MSSRSSRFGAVALAFSLAFVPVRSEALAPVLVMLIKQIAKDAAQSMLKDMLVSSLDGMGCKGVALANALQGLDLRKSAGGGRAIPGMPAGMAVPGMPTGMGVAGMSPGTAMPGGTPIPAGASLPGGAMGLAALDGGDLMARMRSMMAAGQVPSDIDPAQMTRLMQAMSQPLSPPETLAVMDEMAGIGLLSKAMQAELKECMVLVPTAAPALGMGMGMMRTMLPQLRQAREQLHALSPEEQDELVAVLVPEMKALGADERKTLLGFLDGGFFPKRVADGLRAQLGSG